MIEIGMILDHGGISKWYWWTDMIIEPIGKELNKHGC